jgi:protein-disulfide isomerase
MIRILAVKAFAAPEIIFKGANPKVTVDQFADFQCPYCLASANQLLPKLIQKYGDSIEIIFHNYPFNFHPEARSAATAAVCANDQGKFSLMHDYLYAHQASLSQATYLSGASAIGLNIAEFTQCLGSQSAALVIDKDLELAKKLSVNSTPTFFIHGNGKTIRISDDADVEQFESQIDSLLLP